MPGGIVMDLVNRKVKSKALGIGTVVDYFEI